MKDSMERLAILVNDEIERQHCTIKSFSVRCGVSYERMRDITNREIDDIRLSTLERICDNSHFTIADVTGGKTFDIAEHDICVRIDDLEYDVKMKKRYRLQT